MYRETLHPWDAFHGFFIQKYEVLYKAKDRFLMEYAFLTRGGAVKKYLILFDRIQYEAINTTMKILGLQTALGISRRMWRVSPFCSNYES